MFGWNGESHYWEGRDEIECLNPINTNCFLHVQKIRLLGYEFSQYNNFFLSFIEKMSRISGADGYCFSVLCRMSFAGTIKSLTHWTWMRPSKAITPSYKIQHQTSRDPMYDPFFYWKSEEWEISLVILDSNLQSKLVSLSYTVRVNPLILPFSLHLSRLRRTYTKSAINSAHFSNFTWALTSPQENMSAKVQ